MIREIANKGNAWMQLNRGLVQGLVAGAWFGLYMAWGMVLFSGGHIPVSLQVAVVMPFLVVVGCYAVHLTKR